MEPISIIVPRVPLSPNKVIGKHWSFARKDKADWTSQIFAAIPCERRHERAAHQERRSVSIRVIWGARRLDPDNLVASTKPLIDALRNNGMIYNDSADWIELTVEQQLCSHAGGIPRTEIAVESSV